MYGYHLKHRYKFRYRPYVIKRVKKQKSRQPIVLIYGTRIPFPHQTEAINFLSEKYSICCPGTILNIKMGMGKTFIVLRFFMDMLKKHNHLRLLFVTKHDIVDHIKNELNMEINGYFRRSVLVKSYREINYHDTCDILVVDESHSVYNRKKVTETLALIPRRFSILLTGSAGSNREVKNQWKKLVDINDTYSTEIVFTLDDKLVENVVKSANEYNILLELTSSQQAYYQQKIETFKQCQQGIMKLNTMKKIRSKLSSWKIDYVTNVLKDAMNNCLKIVVFSEFASVLLQLRLALPEKGVVACDGTVQFKTRQKQLIDFREKDTNFILITSTNLFSHGVDLGFCHGLVHMEPPWQGYTQKQTNARIERIGQVSAQKILFVLFNNTLETKLLSMNQQVVLQI